jgi:hypothetical protein
MMDQRLLFERPDLFLLGFEETYAVFIEMDRDAYQRSIFLDKRISPAKPALIRMETAPLLALREKAAPAPPSVSYIFHMAHCGSTLLARALDVPGETIVYREPQALRQMGVEAGESEEWRRRLQLVTALLSRAYPGEGPRIVKANVPVNFIIPQLMALNAEARAVLLYFPLEHYLAAILRTPNHRNWVAGISNEMQRGIAAAAPNEARTLAEMAARLWFAQIALYADALAAHPQLVSLNAEDLFNDPRRVVGAAFDYFGAPRSAAKLDAIVSGELFARYSKKPDQKFDNAARLARREALQREIGGEIAEARAWVARVAETRPLPERLANPLSGESPALLARL